ncbi:MAG: glutamine--fructose-6-phosphate transaminase (isomerizing) [Clostridiales bacterium]|nr:glutamine--fructose-6-phosphate transaminase (isomerizing) [Clostridiales bacterium]
MCGIVGYIGKQKAIPILINGLKSLEYRGYDSAGIALLSNEKIDVIKDKGRVSNLESDSLINTLKSTIGIGHTRWATHGIPSKINSHPHLNNKQTIAVVHNGIIENYNELKAKLLKNNYKLLSETDSEVIPNLIDLNNKGNILEAISKTLKELKGSYALGIISTELPDKIIIAKKNNPIVIGKGQNEFFIASDIPAIAKHTQDFYFLDDEQIAVISEDSISFYDINLNKIDLPLKNIKFDIGVAEKNGYEDYMLKEIYEQPKAIRETIGSFLTNNNPINLNIDIDFKEINKIFIIACGTAMHAGMATKYAFEHFCQIPTEIDMASEFRYRNPIINHKTLCIFISQSGETADTIAAIKLAKANSAKTIGIINAIDSTMTRLVDTTLYTHAGPEIAVASTKAYTCQVTLLTILALYISEKLNIRDLKDEIKTTKQDILNLPKLVENQLKNTDYIKEISNKSYKNHDIYFIGRGQDYAVALEGSLKLKEISYIHSEAYASGELKHGPIALIENNTLVLGIATNPVTAPKTMSNIEEVIARGADTIFITNQNSTTDELSENKSITKSDIEKVHYLIEVPEINTFLSPISTIIPMQLFAYYIAKAKKLDVDKPRNLAKSITVE